MALILKYLLYILFLPLWWLQKIIPRKKDVWVFGAWNGYRFSDNSRYLYQYVLGNHPNIKCIWITRDHKIKKEVNQKGGLAYLVRDFKGIYYCLIAENVFLTSGKKDVNYLCINGANQIQLWHGSPLKKIGLNDRFADYNSFLKRNILAVIFPFLYEFNVDYTLSNAPIFTDKMASSFNIPVVRVLETGCPRNDIFFSREQDIFNKGLRQKFRGCRLIYYLPTFRGYEGAKSLFSLEDFDSDTLKTFLEVNNLVFVSKGHYVDNSLTGKNANVDSRLIDLADSDVSDINFMLKDADLMITDYSSAYFDFLLTERPIIFAAFDLKQYLSGSREMYFEYEDVVAGPIVKTWPELFDALAFIWEDSNSQKQVKEKNREFNKYHDADNSRRVYEAIANLTK